MVTAEKKARQFGNAGAWGIVFMASMVFSAGMLYIRYLKRSVVWPLEELSSVVMSVKNGDTMRRSSGAHSPQDIRTIFDGLNDILDKNTQEFMNHKKWK